MSCFRTFLHLQTANFLFIFLSNLRHRLLFRWSRWVQPGNRPTLWNVVVSVFITFCFQPKVFRAIFFLYFRRSEVKSKLVATGWSLFPNWPPSEPASLFRSTDCLYRFLEIDCGRIGDLLVEFKSGPDNPPPKRGLGILMEAHTRSIFN